MERNHICKKCGGIAGWDSYYQSWICTRCGDVERKLTTNYDRIISKTPEELARWIWAVQSEIKHEDLFSTDGWYIWLMQEAKEGE